MSCSFERERFVTLNGESDSGRFGCPKEQLIVQRNGLKDGAQLVISVRALAENVQPEIDFGEG
jgi:hypothetical protein